LLANIVVTSLALCVIGVVILALIFNTRRIGFDIFDPIVPASLVFLLLFGIRPLAMVAFDDLSYYWWIYIKDHLGWALAVCALGVLSYYAGMFLCSEPREAPLRPSLNVRYSLRSHCRPGLLWFLIAVFCSLSAAALIVYLGPNPIGTLAVMVLGRSTQLADLLTVNSEYLFGAPILISCSAIVLLLSKGSYRLDVKTGIVIGLLILVPVAFFYLVGVRRFILPSVFIPVASYFLIRRQRPKTSLLFVALPLFLIFSAIPFMRTAGAREQIGGITQQLSFAFTRPEVIESLVAGPDTEMLPAFAAQIRSMDSIDDYYFGAAVLGDLVIAPIPSALFPKPTSARNSMLISVFGKPCLAGPGGICPDFSIVGTFYQDYWLFGVIFGMGAVGFVSRKWWFSFKRHESSPFEVLRVSVLWIFTIIVFRAGFMPAFQWSLYFYLPSYFLLSVLYSRHFAVHAGAFGSSSKGPVTSPAFPVTTKGALPNDAS
jgi:hypothetical protein